MSPRERLETLELLKSIARSRTMIVIDHDMDAIFELAEQIAGPARRLCAGGGNAGRNKGKRGGPGSLFGGVHAP